MINNCVSLQIHNTKKYHPNTLRGSVVNGVRIKRAIERTLPNSSFTHIPKDVAVFRLFIFLSPIDLLRLGSTSRENKLLVEGSPLFKTITAMRGTGLLQIGIKNENIKLKVGFYVTPEQLARNLKIANFLMTVATEFKAQKFINRDLYQKFIEDLEKKEFVRIGHLKPTEGFPMAAIVKGIAENNLEVVDFFFKESRWSLMSRLSWKKYLEDDHQRFQRGNPCCLKIFMEFTHKLDNWWLFRSEEYRIHRGFTLKKVLDLAQAAGVDMSAHVSNELLSPRSLLEGEDLLRQFAAEFPRDPFSLRIARALREKAIRSER
jgi:hypothetical protein